MNFLEDYVAKYTATTGAVPRRADALRADDDFSPVDVIYPIGDVAFAHVHPGEHGLAYTLIEPRLDPDDLKVYKQVKREVFAKALYEKPPASREELEAALGKLFDVAIRGHRVRGPGGAEEMRYHLIRDVARMGRLEAFLLDENLEDIQAVGTNEVHVVHRYYAMLPTNVRFDDTLELQDYIRTLSERIGRPVSDTRPIVDAALSDGSRINIVFSEDVSRKGPSFSIRRVHEHPISITQLIQWNTLDARTAAYLWLCLENGMSLFFCGEAACGKSATLNALLPFINPRSKIYTAEDTPEVRPPHRVWQRLLTRETGPVESRVVMFDLLRAALRSRPDYIVVGEIRGAEGAVAFQAMQTGHPTVATFHATDMRKMIQRLRAQPIHIPATFIDNLNVAVFQQAIRRDGRLIRRVTTVNEIQGYSEHEKGVITLPVFSHDRIKDEHVFHGTNNSFVLEQKIAAAQGYEDPRDIYDELERRAEFLQDLVDGEVLSHDEVCRRLTEWSLKPVEVAA